MSSSIHITLPKQLIVFSTISPYGRNDQGKKTNTVYGVKKTFFKNWNQEEFGIKINKTGRKQGNKKEDRW